MKQKDKLQYLYYSNCYCNLDQEYCNSSLLYRLYSEEGGEPNKSMLEGLNLHTFL